VVRIQSERGHTTVSTGPYRTVRHPGYAAWLLVLPGSALMLGSWWVLIPAGLTMLVLIVRTALEDRTLLAELPGYQEYAQQTRYRLLPGVW
jgi:protein-S-isoprenylcysteine O-methyltransferase Ste14